MRKLGIILVVLIISALLVVGCSSTAKTTTTTTAPTATTTTLVTTTAPTTTAPITTASKYGGTLRIIASTDMDNLGYPPDMGSMADMGQRTIFFEALVRYDENGKIVPFLAESYQEDANAKTVTFKLRPGIKFQDGTPLDAEAVKWNFEQLATGSVTGYDFMSVSSYDVIDPLTIRVNFGTFNAIFMRSMCWDSFMMSPTAFKTHGKDWCLNNPVGTSPFKLTSFTRDVQKTCERWDGYWQAGKPYLDKIVVDVIADPMTQIASFLKGDDDIVINLDPTDAFNLKSKPGVVLSQPAATGDMMFLWPASANPDSPWNKLEVRQAMSYAVDTQAIVDSIFKGFGVQTNQLTRPGAWSYNPDVAGYPYNPGKARELLSEAGYSTGFDTTLTFNSVKLYQDLYAAVGADLETVGIRAKLQPVDPGQYAEMVNKTGWSDLMGLYIPMDPELGYIYPWCFTSSSASGYAISIKHFADLDQNLAESSQSDLQTRSALYMQTESLTIDKYCIVTPLAILSGIAAKSSRVHDEYTCTTDLAAAWTFADAWMEK